MEAKDNRILEFITSKRIHLKADRGIRCTIMKTCIERENIYALSLKFQLLCNMAPRRNMKTKIAFGLTFLEFESYYRVKVKKMF